MLRPAKEALAYLLIVPAFLAMTASFVCADTLVLAAADTWPTAYLVDGKATGMLIDLVSEAFRRAGHSVEVKLMPWARCVREAETGDVDGVFSSFKLPERERFLAFSKEALTIQVIVFFARPESTPSFDGDLAAVRDVKIGVITGNSMASSSMRPLGMEYCGTSSKPTISRAISRNWRSGASISYRATAMSSWIRQDVCSCSRRSGKYRRRSNSVPTFLAFTKVRDLSKRSEDFDAAMASMKQDGTYDRIIDQYLH